MAIEDWEKVDTAFKDGALLSCDTRTLQNHLLALSNQQIHNESIQHRDVIRGITINHILLQQHIDKLNKQNSKTQWLVIALTVASLLASVIQIFSPVSSYGQHTASSPQLPSAQSGTGCQVKPKEDQATDIAL